MDSDAEKKDNMEQTPARKTPERTWSIPPKQEPYVHALEIGFDTLTANSPSAGKLESLGSKMCHEGIRLAVLDREVLVDIDKREVTLIGGGRLRVGWSLLILHYLNAEDVSIDDTETSLAHLSDIRGYLAVFEKRIVGRFLYTVGRNGERFAELSEKLNGMPVQSNGLGYRFYILPRVPVTIVRYDGDEDFGPGANFVYRADIRNLLPPEDRVVAAELLLDALSGKPFEELPKSL